MNIGIIVAMGKELNLLLPLLSESKETRLDEYTFHSGRVGNHNIVAMQCGIGKVNAAIGTMTLIGNFPLDLIISSGVAGGADKNINVMDVIVADSIAYHDVWCGPGTTHGEAADMPLYFKSSKPISDLIPASPTIKHGLLCSGDIFIDSIDQVNYIKKNFPEAIAVDMESAAIGHVCFKKKIPYFCMRVISDSPGAGHNNAMQYDNFWEDAPKHTFQLLQNLLLKIL